VSSQPSLLTALARRRPAAAAALLLAAAAACGGDKAGVTDPVPVASIAFASEADTVVVGSSKQLSATLRDARGNVVPGATFRWSSSDAAVATVSGTGVATGAWPGAATIVASSGGRSASQRLVVLAAAPTAAAPGQPAAVAPPALPSSAGDGSYDIRVEWPDGVSARAGTMVDAAVARWRRVVTGDLPNVTFDIQAGACYEGQPASRESVDDLLIYVRVVKIDGASGTLARAGPCLVRSGRGLPLVGLVEVDSADITRNEQVVQTVLTHEVGHVLGIGTMWEMRGLLHGTDGENPLFLGATAQAAYGALGGGSSLVYVENSGGEGTKHGHWRETTYRTELMTGWISTGANPLSTITVASLRDLGYAVSEAGADAYVQPVSSGASPRVVGSGVELVDELIRPRFTVDERGRTERLP
jgi:hypothetical protein